MIVHDHNLRFDYLWSMSRRVVVAHFTWREKKMVYQLSVFLLSTSQKPSPAGVFVLAGAD
jgi:hypothetical protein